MEDEYKMRIKIIHFLQLLLVLICFFNLEVYSQTTINSHTVLTATHVYTTDVIVEDSLIIDAEDKVITFQGNVIINAEGCILVRKGSIITEGTLTINTLGSFVADTGRTNYILLGNDAGDLVTVNGGEMLIYANTTNLVDTITGRIVIENGGNLTVGNFNQDDSVTIWNRNGLFVNEGGTFTLQARSVWFKEASGNLLDWDDLDNVVNYGNVIIKDNAIFFIGSMPDVVYCSYSSMIGTNSLMTGFLNKSGTVEVKNNAMMWFGLNAELRSGYVIDDVTNAARIILTDNATVRATISTPNQNPWNQSIDPLSDSDPVPVSYFLNGVTGDQLAGTFAPSVLEMSDQSIFMFHHIICGASIESNDTDPTPGYSKNTNSGYGQIDMSDQSKLFAINELIVAHSQYALGVINAGGNAEIETKKIINADLDNSEGEINLTDDAIIRVKDGVNEGFINGHLTNAKGSITMAGNSLLEVTDGTGSGNTFVAGQMQASPWADTNSKIVLMDNAKIISDVPFTNSETGYASAYISLSDASIFIQSKNFSNGMGAGGVGTLNIEGGSFIFKGDIFINGRNGEPGSGIINLGGGSDLTKSAKLIMNKRVTPDAVVNYTSSISLVLHNPIEIIDTNGMFLVKPFEHIIKTGAEGFEWKEYATVLTRNATNIYDDAYNSESYGIQIDENHSNLFNVDFALLNGSIFEISEGKFIVKQELFSGHYNNEWCYFHTGSPTGFFTGTPNPSFLLPSISGGYPDIPSTVIYGGAGLSIFGTAPLNPYGRLVFYSDAAVVDDLHIGGEVTDALTLSSRSSGTTPETLTLASDDKIVFVRLNAGPFYGQFSLTNIFETTTPYYNIEVIGKMGREQQPYPVMNVSSTYKLHNNLTEVAFSTIVGGNILLELVLASPANVSDYATSSHRYATRKFIVHNADGSSTGNVLSKFQASYNTFSGELPASFITNGVMFGKGCDITKPGTMLQNGLTTIDATNSSIGIYTYSNTGLAIEFASPSTCGTDDEIGDEDEILLLEDCKIVNVKNYYASIVAKHDGFINITITDSITVSPTTAGYTINLLEANGGATKGTASVFVGNVIRYTPERIPTIEYGIDSLRYEVDCGSSKDTGWIYVYIHRTLAGEYWVCPGATTNVELLQPTGLPMGHTVAYYWYNDLPTPTEITSPANPVNSRDISKGSAPGDSRVLVQARWTRPTGFTPTTVIFPIDTVYLYRGVHCGDIELSVLDDCLKNGSKKSLTPFPVVSGSAVGSTPECSTWVSTYSDYRIANTGGLNYTSTFSGLGFYNGSTPYSSRFGGSANHCSFPPIVPGVTDLIVMTNNNQTEINKFIYKIKTAVIDQSEATGICDVPGGQTGDRVMFEVTVYPNHTSGIMPPVDLCFQIRKDVAAGSEVYYTFKTGPIAYNCALSTWAFEFTPPTDSFYITVQNLRSVSGQTNITFMMREPLITVCRNTPDITTVNSTPTSSFVDACQGYLLEMQGTYTDVGQLWGPGRVLYSVWQFSADSITWADVTGTQITWATTEYTITPTLSIAESSADDEGYYRIRVNTAGNESLPDEHACVLLSNPVYAELKKCVVANDDHYYAGMGETITLDNILHQKITDNDVVTAEVTCAAAEDATVTIIQLPKYGNLNFDNATKVATYERTTSSVDGLDTAIYTIVCDLAKDTAIIKFEIPCEIEARNDTTVTFSSIPVDMNVVLNDAVTGGECSDCGKDIANMTIKIITPPSNGYATIPDPVLNPQVIRYTANLSFYGEDFLEYELSCGLYAKDTGRLLIVVDSFPDNVVESDCNLPAQVYAWLTPVKTNIGNGLVSTYQSVVVGDLDGDGLPEIVVSKRFTSGNYYSPRIYIFSRTSNTGPWIQDSITISSGTTISTDAKGPIALARYNGVGYIIVACSDGRLRAYNKAKTLLWTSTDRYVKSTLTATNLHPNVKITNFREDGRPSIVIIDRIFDLETGKLQLVIPDITTVGNPTASALATTGGFTTDVHFTDTRTGTHIALVDTDKDGFPELVWGGKVFKINIATPDATTSNTSTLLTSAVYNPGSGATSLPNTLPRLFTIAADFNKDGDEEILVFVATASVTTGCLYIYDPRTGVILATYQLRTSAPNQMTGASGYGTPFIGCIDGDGIPEILFGQGPGSANVDCRIFAFNVDLSAVGIANRITLKWSLPTSDVSSRETGLTLFDFQQKGAAQIVYRDMDTLRVFDGSADNITPPILFKFPCLSGTLCEYPVVADVDGDGQAEIIVTGGDGTGGTTEAQGYVMIFKAPAGTSWAPARKVWNQYNYYNVHVNDDLTIPKRMFSTSTIMANGSQPFNGFLMQAPSIDKYGNMIQPASDLYVKGDTIGVKFDPNTNCLDVSIEVHNRGELAVNPLCVTIYQDAISPSNILLSNCIATEIGINEIKTVKLCIPLATIHTHMPEEILVRLNDDGTGIFPVALECDTTNNSSPLTPVPLILQNDTAVTRVNENVLIDVLANDITNSCTSTPTIGTKVPPTKGTTAVYLNRMVYTPNSWTHGIDSFEYYVKCGLDSSAAKVYVYVYKPQSLEYYACPNSAVTIGMTAVSSITYSWYNAQTGGSSLGAGLTRSVTKLGDTTQTFWVAATWSGRFTFERYPIYLDVGMGCGGLIVDECVATGSELYKEDFGGNLTSDPSCDLKTYLNSADGRYYMDSAYKMGYTTIPACDSLKVNLACTHGCPQGSFYRKKDRNGMTWGTCSTGVATTVTNGDHTHPDDITKGYFLVLDFSPSTTGTAYGKVIDGLCPNTSLFFGMWLKNITSNASTYHPNVTMEICDVLDTTLVYAQFSTGTLPMQSGANCDWKQYGFKFTTDNQTGIKFRIRNNTPSSDGNDLLMDDIEVIVCLPPIDIPSKDTACLGDDFTLKASLKNNGTFTGDVLSQWQKKDISTGYWNNIGTPQTFSMYEDTIRTSYDFTNVDSSVAGSYRVIIGTDLTSACATISGVDELSVRTCGYGLAVTNGRWSDTLTWFNRQVPLLTDSVVIIPDGKIVYTGATAQAFGGRAFGQGASTTIGTEGIDWQIGSNETGSELRATNLVPSTDTIRLANLVRIESGGALVISQLSNVTGMSVSRASAAGLNDLTAYKLDFGRIENYSSPTTRYVAASSTPEKDILNYNYNSGDYSQIKGLLIVSSSNDTLGHTSGGLLNDASYIYNFGTFKTVGIENIRTSYLKVENGSLVSTGDVINGAGTTILTLNDTIIVDGTSHGMGHLVCYRDIINGESYSSGAKFINRGNVNNIVSGYGSFINGINSVNSYFEMNGSAAKFEKFINGRNSSNSISSVYKTNSSTAVDGAFFVSDSLANLVASATFTMYDGYTNVKGGIYSEGGNFDIRGGRLVHRANGSTENIINTSTPILVSAAGHFIVDAQRIAKLLGNGIRLDNSSTIVSTDYTTEYSSGSPIPFQNVVAQFSVLSDGVLTIESGAGIVNNYPDRTNVFFSRKVFGSALPSKVIYKDAVTIMPTVCSHPYGILELALGHTQAALTTNIYIGGESDIALNFLRTTSISTGSYKFIMNSPLSNITFANTAEIIGTVQRLTCGFGDAIESTRDYTFNNVYTKMIFADAGSNLSEFALTISPNTVPNCLVMPSPLVNSDYRAIRKVVATFNTTSGTPSIQSFSMGYIGGAGNEIADELFSMPTMFGEGYSSSVHPYSWGMATKPSINGPGLSNYTFSGVNISLLMSGNNSATTTPIGPTLATGNEIILFRANVFTTVRHGRWSDPGVWLTGVPPSKTDSVYIRHIIYTGLWDGAGNTDGIGSSTNDLFGSRPYGVAESGINTEITIGGITEAWLAGRLKIVDPNLWAPEGYPTFTGPSALLICNYLSSTTSSATNFFTQCQEMDFNVPLVFSEYHLGLGGETSLTVQTGGSGSGLVLSITNIAEFISLARGASSGYSGLNGLYIIANDTPDTTPIPIIRALNIENEGLIQNEGIIDVGK